MLALGVCAAPVSQGRGEGWEGDVFACCLEALALGELNIVELQPVLWCIILKRALHNAAPHLQR